MRYYGWYSNKMRGVRLKKEGATLSVEKGSAPKLRMRMTWAMLIKAVYEVDPLSCPKCGGTMKIVSFIEDDDVIRSILKHCGLYRKTVPRPPQNAKPPPEALKELRYDMNFLEPA